MPRTIVPAARMLIALASVVPRMLRPVGLLPRYIVEVAVSRKNVPAHDLGARGDLPLLLAVDVDLVGVGGHRVGRVDPLPAGRGAVLVALAEADAGVEPGGPALQGPGGAGLGPAADRDRPVHPDAFLGVVLDGHLLRDGDALVVEPAAQHHGAAAGGQGESAVDRLDRLRQRAGRRVAARSSMRRPRPRGWRSRRCRWPSSRPCRQRGRGRWPRRRGRRCRVQRSRRAARRGPAAARRYAFESRGPR